VLDAKREDLRDKHSTNRLSYAEKASLAEGAINQDLASVRENLLSATSGALRGKHSISSATIGSIRMKKNGAKDGLKFNPGLEPSGIQKALTGTTKGKKIDDVVENSGVTVKAFKRKSQAVPEVAKAPKTQFGLKGMKQRKTKTQKSFG